MIKRAFDFFIALGGLIALAPLLFVIAVLIRLDSQGPVFFRQERVGRHGRLFRIFKFRSMNVNTKPGPSLTVENDSRITKIGRFLRKTKLDELPQLLNVLLGDMSFVGPRPELKKFVDEYPEQYREILTIRPGITDMASIKYRDESALLNASDGDPERYYLMHILPDKLELAKKYLVERSLILDLKLMLITARSIFAATVCRKT